jgi:hypothetical protein
MKRNKQFLVTFNDDSQRIVHARSLEHAIGLVANQDLVVTFEEIGPDGNPKPGGIYQTFSVN